MSSACARVARGLALGLALLGLGVAQAAINFNNTPSGGATAATGMELIRDTAAGNPTGQYVGLRFNSTVSLTNVYARAIVTGTGYSLDATEAQDHFIGDLTSTDKTSYWYINYPATTANGTFQVQIWSGPPSAGGTLQGTSTSYLLRSLDTDQPAAANKINSVTINGGSPLVLGQSFDAVVCYDVNSTTNVLISPAATAAFDPTGLELLGVPSVQFYSTAGCTGTLNSTASNQLYYTGSFSSNSVRATYTFRAMNPLATPLSPIVSARSGQYKFNSDFSTFAGTTVSAATNTVTLAKSVNITSSAGATTVTYTLTASNSGSAAVTLDSFIDTLPSSPATVSYVTGSTTFNGVAIANPVISGQVLTWGNPGGATAFTIPAGGSRSLTFQASIPGTSGAYTNSAIAKIGAVVIDTTLATGDNVPATATTRVGPPVLAVSKTTSTSVISGGTATYTVTVANNGGTAAAGVVLTDTLPNGFTYASTGSVVLAGGATRTSTSDPTAGAMTPAWSTFNIPSGGSVAITFDANVATSVANGNNDNSASVTTTTTPATITNFTGSAQTTDNVTTTSALLSVSKSTSTGTVTQTPTGTSATYTIAVSNSVAATATAVGVSLTDTLPVGFTYASHSAPVLAGGATRPATSDPAANASAPAWGGFSLPPGASVTITFVANIAPSVAAGTYNNSASATTTTLRNTITNFDGAAQTSDNVTVSTASVAVSKSFAAPTLPVGGVTQLTITLSSSSATTLSSVFTDTLPTTPGAMAVASPSNLGGTCTGVTATAGSGSISMAAGSAIPAGGCTIVVDITTNAPGAYTNTIAAGAFATGFGSNSEPASASLTVYAPPTIAKAFSPASITLGGVSTITFTLGNTNAVALSSANFTDTLTNMSVASSTIGGTCASVANSPALAIGATALNLTIPSLPVGGCTVTVDVTSSTAGAHPNSTSGVTTTQTPAAGAASNTVNLTVMAPPTVTKTFLTNPVAKDAVTKLQITLANPNGAAITGAAFTDNYPTSPNNLLVNATTTNAAFTSASVTAGCTGTITATAGARILALTGGTIPANTTCAITVDVLSTSNAGPTYLNSTGPVTTTNAGTGTAATDTLIVVNGVTVSKLFSPMQIPEGDVSQMTVTLGTTAGGSGTSAVAFTDTYPSGLVNVTGTPVISNSCGGTLTAASGGGSFSLSGGAIPANSSCTIVIAVTAATVGNYTNVISASSITSSSGTNAFGDSATLNVLLRPTVSKSFAVAGMQSGGSTTLTINVGNPNSVALTLASALTDTMPTAPGAMTVASPNGLGGTCTGVTAVAGSGSVSMAAGSSIPAGGCTITVDVTASTAGAYTNTITAGAVATTGAGSNTAPGSASLTVYSTPTIAKAFSPASIVVNTTSTLTFTLGNGNASALTSANFTDTLSNMSVASTTIGGTCAGVSNSPALTVGTTALNLTVPSLPAGGCTVTVQVTSPTIGAWPNVASGVTTTQTPSAGAGSNNATLTVTGEPHLLVSKTTSTPTLVKTQSGATATYTITVANTGSAAATGVEVSDALPAGFTHAATSSVTLNGAALAGTAYTTSGTTNPGWTSNPGGGFTVDPGQNLTIVFTAAVASTTANGTYSNSASAVSTNAVSITNFNGAAATADDVTVTSAVLATTKTTSTPAVTNTSSGATATYTITVSNSGNAQATGVKVSDQLPTDFSHGSTASVTMGGATQAYSVVTSGAQTAATPQWDTSPTGGFTIPAGQSLVIVFSAAIAPGVGTGTYSNSASATGVAASIANFDGSAATTDDVSVSSGVTVSGTVYADINHNAQRDTGESGTLVTLYAKLVAAGTPSGPASQVATADPTTGAYSFTGVAPGEYLIVLDDNANLNDVSATLPAGWAGTEVANGVRSQVVVASVELQNLTFGLFNGSRLSGRVFVDNGAGGGIPNDGVQNGSEPGLAGVTLRRTIVGGTQADETAQTNGAGDYTLWIPFDGANTSVRIVQTNLSGHVSTGGAAGTTGGSYTRSSDWVTLVNVNGSTYSGVNFADVRDNALATNGQQTAAPGTVLYYAHTFTPGTGGSVSFNLSAVASPGTATGFTQVLAQDSNCNGVPDAGEPVLALGGTVVVSADTPLCVLVKEQVPGNAPQGASNALTLTANFSYTNASPTLSSTYTNTDLTTVGEAGALALRKSQSTASVLPGSTITYTVEYQNHSTSALSNIRMRDATPSYTRFVSAACGTPLPSGITACTVTTQPASGASGTIEWTLTGSLASAAKGTITFTVQVAN